MLKTKQIVIIVVAAIIMIATVNHFLNNGEVCEPVTLSPEPIVKSEETVTITKPQLALVPNEIDLDSVYSAIISNEGYTIEFTKSMDLEGICVELLTGALSFNNMTGDCHVSVINDNYTADMWSNVDTGDGYLTMSNTVTGDSVDWVKITANNSDVVNRLFYNTNYTDLMGIIESIFEEADCYTEEYIAGQLDWKLVSNCHSGLMKIKRLDNIITVTIENPEGTDVTRYRIVMGPVETVVPDICTQKTSTLSELHAVVNSL